MTIENDHPWENLRIENLACHITVGFVGSMSSLFVEKGVPLLRGQNIRPYELDLTNLKYISPETHQKWKKSALMPGDVAIVRVGYPGTACVIPKGLNSLNAASLVIVRPNPKLLDPHYLTFVLNSPQGVARIQSLLVGAAQQVLNTQTAAEFEIPAPPLAIQRRIGEILGAYNKLIENNQRRIHILEEMVRSHYREWFVKFHFPEHGKVPLVESSIGMIPQGWKVKNVNEVALYLSRGLSPTYSDEGGSRVLNQKCIRDQRISLGPSRQQIKTIPADKLVRFGDVLINSTGVGTLGRVAQVYEHYEQLTVDSHITIVRPKEEVDPDYFGCLMFDRQGEIERLGVGATGQTELSRDAVGNLEVVVPPNEIQLQFGKIVRPLRLAASNYLKKNQNLRQTRDLLLPRLLSGRINLDVPTE